MQPTFPLITRKARNPYFRRFGQSPDLATFVCSGNEITCHVDEADTFERETGIALDSDVIDAVTFAKLADFLSRK